MRKHIHNFTPGEKAAVNSDLKALISEFGDKPHEYDIEVLWMVAQRYGWTDYMAFFIKARGLEGIVNKQDQAFVRVDWSPSRAGEAERGL